MREIEVAGVYDVSLSDLAKRLNLHSSQVYKMAKSVWFEKLGIKFRTLKNPVRGKTGWYITSEECERVISEYIARREHKSRTKDDRNEGTVKTAPVAKNRGKMLTFYLCDSRQMHDGLPLVKLGITEDPKRRLEEHQTHWPNAQMVRTWPTKGTWDQTAMDCLGRAGTHVKGELWTGDLEAFCRAGDEFFMLMGTIDQVTSGS